MCQMFGSPFYENMLSCNFHFEFMMLNYTSWCPYSMEYIQSEEVGQATRITRDRKGRGKDVQRAKWDGMRWMENSHDGSSSIESYLPRFKMPDTDNKPQGPLDVIDVGSSYCYQIPSFSIIPVELRNFWDDEEKRTGIYDLFMREDPSGEVRKRFPDGCWSLLPAIPSSHRISGLFAPRANKDFTIVWGKHKT